MSVSVFDLDIAELERAVAATTVPACDEDVYARVLYYYLRNRVAELSQQLSTMPEGTLLTLLARARLAIRTGVADEPTRLALAAAPADGAWAAERCMVLAIYAETFRDMAEARDLYLASYEGFTRSGNLRRAAAGYQNHVAAESKLHPSKTLIYEYRNAHRIAMEAGAHQVAGTALMNLSREYQEMGANLLALEHADQAVALMAERSYGSRHYYAGVCHRAHVRAEMGMEQLALMDLEEASTSDFPEIVASVAVVRKVLAASGATLERTQVKDRVPAAPQLRLRTWKEREGRLGESARKLSEHQNKLIALLATGPLTSLELTFALYGEGGDFFAKENRLKQTLHRIRKAHPRLIMQREGRYVLLDDWSA